MIALLVALAPLQAAATPPPPPARAAHVPGDPLERFNRRMFRSHQGFDRHVLRPAALAYKHVVPKFLRSALRGILSTLGEPVVFVNYLLQGKPGKAAETLGRFTINVGLGLGGAIDVAKLPGVRLPHRPNGFGDTLGFYGVKPGPYLFLPFVGPTDLRDLFGGQADGLVLPLAVGKPFDRAAYGGPEAVISGLDRRAEADADLKALLDDAVDPYATLRSVYLQDRAGEIAQLKGRPAAAATPTPELGEPLGDPANAHPPAGSASPELQDPLADPAASAAAPTPAPAPPASTAPELQDPLADPAGAAPQRDAGPPAPRK